MKSCLKKNLQSYIAIKKLLCINVFLSKQLIFDILKYFKNRLQVVKNVKRVVMCLY